LAAMDGRSAEAPKAYPLALDRTLCYDFIAFALCVAWPGYPKAHPIEVRSSLAALVDAGMMYLAETVDSVALIDNEDDRDEDLYFHAEKLFRILVPLTHSYELQDGAHEELKVLMERWFESRVALAASS
jgi:hypothetical protein